MEQNSLTESFAIVDIQDATTQDEKINTPLIYIANKLKIFSPIIKIAKASINKLSKLIPI
jgi:hypothetical protein